jgi:hypothetical protein
MRKLIKKIPVIGSVAHRIYRNWINPRKRFTNSTDYWADRYNTGGNSGKGSYGDLAKFKAEVINQFVQQNNVTSIIEYGSGDGNQLKLAKYPIYTGFDVSAKAIEICKEIFLDDVTKTFKMVDDYKNEVADLTLSLDVILHLVEEDVFVNYMHRLFNSSERFVIIYSSNTDENPEVQGPHVKHRKFTKWVSEIKSEWQLIQHIPNKYAYSAESNATLFADFFIYAKV